MVGPGQTVTSDFALPLRGTISGRVLDENDEPVPGIEVALIAREYGAGAIRYFRRNVAGVQREWWYHRFGCELWFLAERDTRTNEVLKTELPQAPVRTPAAQ